MAATHPFTLALIAHDGKKDDMLRFAREHLDELREVDLIATATTGSLLMAELGLDIETTASGPQGGDLQIGARIVEGRIHEQRLGAAPDPLAPPRASRVGPSTEGAADARLSRSWMP